MIECSFATLLNANVKYQRKIDRGSAIRFIQGKEGTLIDIDGVEEARKMPGVQEVELYMKPGDCIRRPENSSDRVGHVIAIGENADEAARNAENALGRIQVRTG